jgi:hypothetical protein
VILKDKWHKLTLSKPIVTYKSSASGFWPITLLFYTYLVGGKDI